MTGLRAIVLCLAAGALTGASGPAQAQQREQQGSQRLESPRAVQEGAKSVTQRTQTITGEIDAFRHMDPSGAASEGRSLIRIRLENGRQLVADVGPKRNLDRFNLERGQQITITGRFERESGREVLKAERLRVDGQSISISRRGQQRSGSENTESLQTVSGKVEGFRQVVMRGSRGQRLTNTLARLELENGGMTVVNLGPKSRLDSLNLKKGERVRVQAREGKLNGKRILLARRLKLVDRTDKAQRSGSAEAATRGQPVTVRGKVQGYQVASFGAGNREQVLLRLELQDGRSVLVDAGQYQSGELNLKDLNLGDQVTIRARRVENDNRQRLVGESIRFQDPQGGSGEDAQQHFPDSNSGGGAHSQPNP